MVIAGFLLQDKLGKAQFFEETFLLADISIKIVLGIPFLTLYNSNVCFAKMMLI